MCKYFILDDNNNNNTKVRAKPKKKIKQNREKFERTTGGRKK